MVKKWQTLIEAYVDVKTTDGYLLRVFCIGFTQKQQQSTKKHCYAQSQQIRQIRKKMVDIITREVSTVDLKEVVNKLIPDSMSMDIQKACQGIYPLHGEGSGKATTTTTDPTTGEVVERPEGYEPPVQERPQPPQLIQPLAKLSKGQRDTSPQIRKGHNHHN